MMIVIDTLCELYGIQKVQFGSKYVIDKNIKGFLRGFYLFDRELLR